MCLILRLTLLMIMFLASGAACIPSQLDAEAQAVLDGHRALQLAIARARTHDLSKSY